MINSCLSSWNDDRVTAPIAIVARSSWLARSELFRRGFHQQPSLGKRESWG
jgi:hypothetical protein